MEKSPLINKIFNFFKENFFWMAIPFLLIIILLCLAAFFGRFNQSMPFAYTPY